MVVIVLTCVNSLNSAALYFTSVSHVHPPSSVLFKKLLLGRCHRSTFTCFLSLNLGQVSALLKPHRFVRRTSPFSQRRRSRLDTVLSLVNNGTDDFLGLGSIHGVVTRTTSHSRFQRVNRLLANRDNVTQRIVRSLSVFHVRIGFQFGVFQSRNVIIQFLVVHHFAKVHRSTSNNLVRIERRVLVTDFHSPHVVKRVHELFVFLCTCASTVDSVDNRLQSLTLS